MRIRRGPLFWGLLLIPLGAIPLLARAGYLDASRFGDVGRFWPLILVGIGVAILLGRGRASLIGTAVVALLLGTLGGAALATGNLAVGGITDCTVRPGQLTDTEGGAFDGRASITIDLDCGSVDVATTEDARPGLDARRQLSRPAAAADHDRVQPGPSRSRWRRLAASGLDPGPARGRRRDRQPDRQRRDRRARPGRRVGRTARRRRQRGRPAHRRRRGGHRPAGHLDECRPRPADPRRLGRGLAVGQRRRPGAVRAIRTPRCASRSRTS